MRKQVRAAAAALVLVLGAALRAAEKADAKTAWIDGRMEKMVDKLDLTPRQQAAARAALQAQADKLAALRREAAQRRRTIQGDADDAIERTLTPAQKKKYRAMKGDMNQREAEGPEADAPSGGPEPAPRRGRGSGHGGGMGRGY